MPFVDSNKLLIGKEGAIKGLVAMLKATDEEAKLKAATTITVLAFKNGSVFSFILEAVIGLFKFSEISLQNSNELGGIE